MMYPRLKLARNLLRDDGLILISIDEHETKNLKALCEEVFGEENFICEFVWKKKSGGGGDVGSIVVDHEYILAYGRTSQPRIFNDPDAEVTTQYNKVDEDGRRYSLDRLDKQSLGYQESLDFPIEGPDGKTYTVIHKDPKHKVARWRWGKDTVRERHDELVFEWPYVYTRNYEKEDGAKARSLLVTQRFGRTRTGKTDLKRLFGVEIMDHPKPVRLMQHLLNISVETGDVVLDFFAGSCPLAEAVLRNAHDGRAQARFIMVQLPEAVSEDSQNGRNALALGCRTIADIGKKRIRRVVEEVEAEQTGTSEDTDTSASGPDLGFRVFTLDASNVKSWDADFNNLEDALLNAVESIKPERSEEDVLYELLLKYGLDLAVPIEERQIGGRTVHIIGAGALMVCLSEDISLDVVEGIAALKDELKPEVIRVVFRDAGFEDDVVKTNAVQVLRQAGIKDVKSV